MARFNLPRGTKDILPGEVEIWQKVEATARNIFSQYNFSEIRTPVFETSGLFNRVIGEYSDIVQKEMYTFQDKGSRELALRPEGTAPIARAYISNNLNREMPESKLFYVGPMFRYERPQAGRYRQFHQIGVESIGSYHPFQDAEVIALSYRLFTALGLKKVKIKINSVGSETCRPVIEARIKQFLSANLHQLSDDLKEKFKHNPLKILDSKDEKLQTYLSGLPDLREALSQESKDHFNLVLEYLDSLKIPFEYKPDLVRGLDYYTETVFEVISDELGTQNSICGGGRYNNLIKEIGGPDTGAVGFAFGLERLVMLLQQQKETISNDNLLIYIAPLSSSLQFPCIQLAEELRDESFNCLIDYNRTSLNSHMKKANKIGADYIVIYGESEHENQSVTIKNMKCGTQSSHELSKCIQFFQTLGQHSYV